ncbi:hypothetical protein [Brevundimonas sp. DS20]|uniref:hypothetical protein n=1 Tax=Brevundimonas sp. DS20 TaxID=1532555 RepID=UPI0006D10BAB|nr:hypothetical protein [Brevundimonas sp. DS20]ALJ08698.1 hypothetical protein JL11_10345 [Brevundimonas sp. DS20]
MDQAESYIELKLDIDDPIEVGEFVAAFTSIAAEYNRFNKIDAESGVEATLFVKEVTQGCIVAQLVPLLPLLSGSIEGMSAIITIEDFVKRYHAKLSTYLKPGGRAPDVSRNELKDFSEQVAAIASHPGSNLSVAAIEIKDGQKRVKAGFKFDTNQARDIQDRVAEHRRELDHIESSDHKRVLMVFTQTNTKWSPLGKRSGDLVTVDKISGRALPLVYASQMAEDRIKHEITVEPDNVYKKGFVVDLNVDYRAGKPIAYSVTHVHQVIDLPDDEEAA